MAVAVTQSKFNVLDPSDRFRPEKSEALFRDFTENCAYYERVRQTYYNMHTHQSMEFVQNRTAHWTQFNHTELNILDALEKLNIIVDESDPDVDVPNSVHAYQTAERIRQAHPDKPWLQLTGLIHDLGKLMATYGEPQYAIVGDTFPLGCQFSDKIVFGRESFRDNPDIYDSKYNTKLGIYEEEIGLDNVTMSWGHDEYLYRVLKNTPVCTLPEEAMYIIRYHSFYPWHTSGEYHFLMNDKDRKMLTWINEFNKFDLYSKSDSLPDPDALRPYYQSLINQYVPGTIKW